MLKLWIGHRTAPTVFAASSVSSSFLFCVRTSAGVGSRSTTLATRLWWPRSSSRCTVAVALTAYETASLVCPWRFRSSPWVGSFSCISVLLLIVHDNFFMSLICYLFENIGQRLFDRMCQFDIFANRSLGLLICTNGVAVTFLSST